MEFVPLSGGPGAAQKGEDPPHLKRGDEIHSCANLDQEDKMTKAKKQKQVRYIPKKLDLSSLKVSDPAGLIPVLERYGGVLTAPLTFLQDLYPAEYLETSGDTSRGKYQGNPLTAVITSWPAGKDDAGNYRRRQRTYTDIVTSDYSTVMPPYLESRDYVKDVFISECGYLGRQRKKRAITCMYGLAIDLDYQTAESLYVLLDPMSHYVWYPWPTYITLSGTGVHLWYLFVKPLELYHGAGMGKLSKRYADLAKEGIIRRIWNPHTVRVRDEKGNQLGLSPQIQSIAQSYRMPGTPTKQRKLCTVYKMTYGRKYGDFDDIMSAIRNPISETKEMQALSEAIEVDTGYRPASGHNLEYWKEKNPDWYQRVVVEGKRPKRGHYTLPRTIYDHFLSRVPKEAVYGTRYWCMWSLVVLGKKCGLSKKEIQAALEQLIPELTRIEPEHPMEDIDLQDALEIYRNRDTYYIRTEVIEKKTHILFQHHKHNGRSQVRHLTYARGVRELRMKMGENLTGGGRPAKKEIVKQWRAAHPKGTKKECIIETGLGQTTVYKWWDAK